MIDIVSECQQWQCTGSTFSLINLFGAPSKSANTFPAWKHLSTNIHSIQTNQQHHNDEILITTQTVLKYCDKLVNNKTRNKLQAVLLCRLPPMCTCLIFHSTTPSSRWLAASSPLRTRQGPNSSRIYRVPHRSICAIIVQTHAAHGPGRAGRGAPRHHRRRRRLGLGRSVPASNLQRKI